MFIESPKGLCFITAVIEDFWLFVYVFHNITKLQTRIQDQQIASKCEGAETFRKNLAL